jgi:hypothetical protein
MFCESGTICFAVYTERVCAYEATKYKLMQQINIIKRSTILFFI